MNNTLSNYYYLFELSLGEMSINHLFLQVLFKNKKHELK